MPNQLLKAKSPYLLQHAENPVHWFEWGKEALELAKQENKIIIVSIGYSACHWCHVMAHESFEDEQTAAIMNEHFINIKIDREERPDLDAIYMDACQLITGSGGWPLNAFVLPDGSPFHAGTYFKKHQWQQILMQIAQLWKTDENKVLSYATNLKEGIIQSSGIAELKAEPSEDNLKQVLASFEKNFDVTHGGFNRAPKFPMPVAWETLLIWGEKYQMENVSKHTHFTLLQMANGGIYDWAEGGFARYSVDAHWFAPHFEKMLYDNAQLISLYSKAAILYNDNVLAKIAEESTQFVMANWRARDHGFFSAFDADSEGVEGQYYCLTESEVDAISFENKAMFKKYFQITSKGNWEHGLNILYPILTADKFAVQEGLTNFDKTLEQWRNQVFSFRKNKVMPGLDDKQNTCWNGLLLTAFCDVYALTGKKEYLLQAIDLRNYLTKSCFINEILFHIVKDNKPYIDGFLEDYTACIAANIRFYEVFKDENAIIFAKTLADKAFTLFFNSDNGFFNMSNAQHHQIIEYKIEVTDNVIPSANAIMCENLLKLGLLLELPKWINVAENMLAKMKNKTFAYPDFYAKWLNLLAYQEEGYPFVVCNLVVPNKLAFKFLTIGHFNPTSTIAAVSAKKWNSKSAIYICTQQVCQPVVTGWDSV